METSFDGREDRGCIMQAGGGGAGREGCGYFFSRADLCVVLICPQIYRSAGFMHSLSLSGGGGGPSLPPCRGMDVGGGAGGGVKCRSSGSVAPPSASAVAICTHRPPAFRFPAEGGGSDGGFPQRIGAE